ncbi:MAG: VWA domain-containing protein, partial [Planctomycetota bacterium]
MSDFPLEFGRPWFLLLAIPAIWWTIHIARRSLAGQSEGWARFGLVLRVFLIGILVCALADVRLARTGKGLTVFFLLDRSASIPLQRSDEAYRWIAEKSASIDKDDRAGLIVYGRDASIERDAARELRMSHIESVIDRDATNTEGALLLAQAAFSSSRATGGKRVVIVSDGNANVGDAELAARNLALSGVVVDVLPVDFSYPAEILIDGLSVPAEVHPEEPYVVSVVVHSEVATKARIQLYENDEQIATRDVDLDVGKTRVEFATVHGDVGRYRYEARLFEIG